MNAFRIRATVGLVGAAAVALAAVIVPPLGATSASATHPCARSSDGSPSYDSGVSSDHDACTPPPSPQQGDVVLRETDAGSTVTVVVGTRLFVQLASGWTGPLWTDITGGGALHRVMLDEQRPSTTAVFVPGRTSDAEQVVAKGGPSPWSVTVVVVAATEPQPTPSATSCTAVPWNGDGTLSDADAGRTVTVARGDVVVVAFAGCSGVDHQAATADGPLSRYRARSGNPGAARSIFSAAATGTATITAVTDAACFHTSPACAMPQQVWQVTVTIVEQCTLTGDPSVGAGSDAALYGRFAPGATVQIWFRPYGGTSFTVRRTLTADGQGGLATSYRALADQRWYATSNQGCTTAVGLTRAAPWVEGPAEVRRGTTVPLIVHGPAGQPVQVWFKRYGQDWALRRAARLDAAGRYATSYRNDVDHRWYAVTGPDHRRSPLGLTLAR